MVTQRKRANQRKVADALYARIVRSEGICAVGYSSIPGDRWSVYANARVSECGGNLQCAHVIEREYLATRYERTNVLCLCSAHHVWFTHHNLEWRAWCKELLGVAVFEELERVAMDGVRDHYRPDYKTLIPKLRAELENAGSPGLD